MSKRLVRTYPHKRLRQHGAIELDTYLNTKSRLHGDHEWQSRKIADALRILFMECVQSDWAQNYNWHQWKTVARDLEPDHPTLAREGQDLVAPSKNGLVSRFRSDYTTTHSDFIETVRIRNMSIWTEQTYEHWLARFLAFHHWKSLDELTPDHIASFLEHLALERRVTASTQKVALNAMVFLFREVMG